MNSVRVAYLILIAAAASGCATRTYNHRLEYVPIPSPISTDIWLIQQDRDTNADHLMVCRMANLEPMCRFYNIEPRTSTVRVGP